MKFIKVIQIFTGNGNALRRKLGNFFPSLGRSTASKDVPEVFGGGSQTIGISSIGEILSSGPNSVNELELVKQIEKKLMLAKTQAEVQYIIDNSGLSIQGKKSISDLINMRLRQLCGTSTTIVRSSVKNLDSIQSKFSTLFGRNISQKEAYEMALKYNKIFAEKNDEKFVEQLVKQMITDYGFNLGDIPVKFSKALDSGSNAGFSISEGLLLNENYLSQISNINKRKELFSSIAHELWHAKEYKIACQTDVTAFINAEAEYAMFNGSTDEALGNALQANGNDVVALLQSVREQIRNTLLPLFKEQPQIPEHSPLYPEGLAYIESRRNYKLPNMISEKCRNYGYDSLSQEEINAIMKEYRDKQLLEKEAYFAGDTASEIFNLIMG